MLTLESRGRRNFNVLSYGVRECKIPKKTLELKKSQTKPRPPQVPQEKSGTEVHVERNRPPEGIQVRFNTAENWNWKNCEKALEIKGTGEPTGPNQRRSKGRGFRQGEENLLYQDGTQKEIKGSWRTSESDAKERGLEKISKKKNCEESAKVERKCQVHSHDLVRKRRDSPESIRNRREQNPGGTAPRSKKKPI